VFDSEYIIGAKEINVAPASAKLISFLIE